MKPTCGICGCTDERACTVEVDGVRRGCRWITAQLCSACSGAEHKIAGPPPPLARIVSANDQPAAPPLPTRAPTLGELQRKPFTVGEVEIEISHACGLVLLGLRGKKVAVLPADALLLAGELKEHAEAANAEVRQEDSAR